MNIRKCNSETRNKQKEKRQERNAVSKNKITK